MKYIQILTAAAAVALLSACGNTTTKEVTLASQADSLNYAFGVANGQQIQQYYLASDSTGEKLKQLIKGIQAGMKEDQGSNPELANLGKQIGSSLKMQAKDGLMGDSTLTVDIDLIKQGLVNGMNGSDILMNEEEAQTYLQTTMQALQAKRMEAQYGENKAAGMKFLAENATREGVQVTESGLQYEVLQAGKGATPALTDRVKVNYHGTLIDGTVFDSSIERGEPAEFVVNQVIPGWTEALQMMPVGSKWKIYLPYTIAYGDRDTGKIKPFSALIFEVELLSIEK